MRLLRSASGDPKGQPDTAEHLLTRVARGEDAAFAALYDRLAPLVLGVVRRVLRDPAQSEEVTQEVMVEVWRTATRFDPAKGTAAAWVLTMAHRRAVDRVRSAAAATERDFVVGLRDQQPAYDEVAEAVESRIEREQVRKALDALTDVQRQAVELAYYGGYSYPEVATLLGLPLGTVKTRVRDGLIRLRDAMGVSA